MSLKILQWNIKGYSNNYNELILLIKEHHPNIISLQETHLHSTTNIPIPINFTLHTINSSTTNYGGVCLLVHKSIQHTKLPTNSDFDAITLKITSKQIFNIISTYIPPTKHFTIRNLQNILDKRTHPTLITGDFNSHHRQWGSINDNRRGKILNKYIHQSNYILLNNGNPTHISTHNTLTNIDLTFCSPTIKPHAEWNTLDSPHGSDHLPIIISLFKKPTPKKPALTRPKFKINQANWTKYEKCINEYNSLIPPSQNPNKEAATITKIIIKSANTSIPSTKNNSFSHNVPWWNKNLEYLKKLRNKSWNDFKRNLTIQHYITYKKNNAKFKRETKLAKKESINKLTTEINPSTPTKNIWAKIRHYCGYSTTHGIHAILTSPTSTQITTDQTEIANALGKHWSNLSSDSNFSPTFITAKTSSLLNPPNYPLSPKTQPIENKITYLELCGSLNRLKGHTPGIDRIPYPLLKMLPKPVKLRILQHFNNIFNNYIPQLYKTSIVIPILKTNSDKTSTNSYRPISLNPCIAKVLDRIIADRLWWFVTANNLLSSSQMGFQKGKAVTDSLLCIDYHATSALSKKRHLSIISLDFEKAFDKVGVHSIIDQLKEWQLGPKTINYITNFMQNRKIIVKVSNHTSNNLPLHNGIPQGSPLSVILFLIAYNKLSSIITKHKEIKLHAYADDFNLTIPLSKEKSPTIDKNQLFHEISLWCDYSGAKLSTVKCRHRHICRKKNCKPTILSGNTSIPETNNLKILGITFNTKYNWLPHINSLCQSLNKKVDIIKCLANHKHNCNTYSLISIIHTLIISKIRYGLPIFGHAPLAHIRKIKTILNNSIRTSLGALRSTPTLNLYLETNIPPLDIQIELQTAKTYKSLLHAIHSPLHDIIKQIARSNKKPKIPSAIHRTIKVCKTLNIPHKPTQNPIPPPHWHFKQKTIDTHLKQFNKSSTHHTTYQLLFKEITNKYNQHKFIYTDASQLNETVGYSITQKNTTIKTAILPHYSSNYSGELIAIYEATKYAKWNKKHNFCICTDSLSSLDAISNIHNNNHYTNQIRNIITQHYPKITLIWTPGHSKIQGNEFADKIAKLATLSPLTTTDNLNPSDINNFLKNNSHDKQKSLFPRSSSWYQNINKNKITGKKALDIELHSVNRVDHIKFERIRLGHTKLTHKHLMSNETPPICTCNQNTRVTITHLLSECPLYTKQRNDTFDKTNPISTIENPNPTTVKKITTFLKKTNTFHLI